jgi:hypothetical protein
MIFTYNKKIIYKIKLIIQNFNYYINNIPKVKVTKTCRIKITKSVKYKTDKNTIKIIKLKIFEIGNRNFIKLQNTK